MAMKRPFKPTTAGSIPARPTLFRSVVQGKDGRPMTGELGFKSSRFDHAAVM
jgi:hypothetical protein